MTPEVKKESGLVLFSNPKFGGVRVVMRDGEPWFAASDVAKALGYANPSVAVNQHCKKAIKTAFNANRVDGSTPPININLIPESDLYRLVMRSNVPDAEEFQAWVCEEVLPSIRKTGSYSVSLPKTLPEALRAYADEVERREQAERTLQKYDTVLGQMVDLARQQQATIGAQADELGIGEHYKAVTGIPWLSDYFDLTDVAYKQIGRALTEWSRVLGYEKLMVKHPRFPKGVGNYHVDVIDAFRRKLDNDPMYLAKYRKIVCLSEGL